MDGQLIYRHYREKVESVIYFLHYVARLFCETIKLPIEMPKIILGILGIFPVYPG
jgi:hypothetical protein